MVWDLKETDAMFFYAHNIPKTISSVNGGCFSLHFRVTSDVSQPIDLVKYSHWGPGPWDRSVFFRKKKLILFHYPSVASFRMMCRVRAERLFDDPEPLISSSRLLVREHSSTCPSKRTPEFSYNLDYSTILTLC